MKLWSYSKVINLLTVTSFLPVDIECATFLSLWLMLILWWITSWLGVKHQLTYCGGCSSHTCFYSWLALTVQVKVVSCGCTPSMAAQWGTTPVIQSLLVWHTPLPLKAALSMSSLEVSATGLSGLYMQPASCVMWTSQPSTQTCYKWGYIVCSA